MVCAACGFENPPTAKFCSECAAPLHQSIECPQCGTANAPGSKFCNECAHPLATSIARGSSSPSPTATPHPTAFCDGRYEVKRFLGEGGKKRVYLARDTKLDRDVAFALIKTDGLDAEGQARVRREAQAMGRLGDHPHIVSVYDIGELPSAGDGGWGLGVGGTSLESTTPTQSPTPAQPYLVSQLMVGGDVEQLIERAENHRVPLAQALAIAAQVCQALEYAHSQGIVHRDLKPGNVWLTADGTAKLGDFGLALSLDRSRLTQVGMMVGTVSYMPPEQAMGGDVTARSDLYSLGAMLYEMVTGRPPFVGDESVAIITQHLNTPPVAPSWHVPDLPSGMEALIMRLLEKDPANRPASAADVRQALAGVNLSPSPSPARGGETTPPSLEGKGDGGLGPNPIYRRIFVGREAELRRLQAAFDGALSGSGSLLAVVGEPGIGKTALCEQLGTYAAMRGGKTLVGHCYEEGSLSLPYLAFVEAMRAYVLDQEPAALKRDLGTGAEEVAKIVSEIRERLSLSGPQHSALTTQHSSDPDEERWRLFQAVSTFLRNASAVQPIVVVLEDLHWADRGTLDLLIHMARNLAGARLLFVATYRDVEVDRSHPLSAALAELRRVSAFGRVPLRGLSADEVQRMLSAITGQSVPWGFAETVFRQTEGNPLFVQEVVRYLAEEGLIKRDDGHWQRAGTTPLEMSIPEGLRDVIGKRLSRLSPECNRLLAVAAVIGRDFALQTLVAVAGMGEDALLDALEEAVRVGVLQEQERVGGATYRFAHAFFRQTLYEETSVPRRLRLHQQVARALEAQYGARVGEHAAELADHFAHSSDPVDLARAVEYGERAASRAMAVYAYGEAARHLERAIEVQEVVDPDAKSQRCDLLLALAEALMPAGEPQRAYETVAEEAFSLAEGLGDRARAERACLLALEALYRFGSVSAFGMPEYRIWAERLDHYAEPGTRARVYADTTMAEVRRRSDHLKETRILLDRALDLAKRLDEPETLFWAAVNGLTPMMPAECLSAQVTLARDLALHPRDGVRAATLAGVLRLSQIAFLATGEREAAEAIWAEMKQLAERTHDPALILMPLAAESLRAFLAGDLEEAVEIAERLVERGAEIGSSVAAGMWSANLTRRPLTYLGRTDAIEARLSDRRGPRNDSSQLAALAAVGRWDEARLNLTEWVNRVADPEVLHETSASTLAWVLEAAVLLQERPPVVSLTERLADVVAAPQSPWAVSPVGRQVAEAAVMLGDRERARTSYEKALAWAKRIRHRPEIALTRLGMAELLLGEANSAGLSDPDRQSRRAEAQAHLDFAIDEFRAMKMQPSLERALRHKGLLSA